MLRRVIYYSLGTVTLLGTAKTLHKNEYEIDAIAVVRISRAALTALDIGYCYKSQLYSKNLDSGSQEYRDLRSVVHKKCAEKLLGLCKTNKGVYIKVGQHIGALDYLLPQEYVDTMKVLHKDAPQNTIDQLYRVIREDLKQDPEELFTEFDPEPLGTASLAQVHKAKLKDGNVVAVKVQHHFVRNNTKADIRSMEILVNILSWVFKDFSIEWLVNETKHNIFHELDFVEEGKNSEELSRMFKKYTWLQVPKVYWDYSTDRVLVMEYIEGGQVNDLRYVQEHNINPYDLCRKLGDLYSHMIFVHGFVHSDPHPGNIVLKKSPEDKDVTVYLLDHGLYARLTDEFRYNYSQFWLSIISKNHDKMKFYASKLGIKEDMYGALACIVTGRPWSAINKGIGNVRPAAQERDLIREQLPDVIDKIALCLQSIDRQALLILKTNDLIRSIEHSLKTSDMMCGFAVMTKCCLVSVYDQRLKQTSGFFRRLPIKLAKFWTLFKFLIAVTFLNLRASF